MNRSKEKALEYESSLDYYHYTSDNPSVAYEAGHEQAEEDLALTIEDIEVLHAFLYAVKNNKTGVFTFTSLSEEQYQEVLRRFNNRKMIEK